MKKYCVLCIAMVFAAGLFVKGSMALDMDKLGKDAAGLKDKAGAVAKDAEKKTAETKEAVKSEEWKKKVFSPSELKEYNGTNGKPVYVAVDGIVYDLSGCEAWKTGMHVKMHAAGQDLTDAYKNKAPKSIHMDKKNIEKFPKVGILVDKEGIKQGAEKAEKGKKETAEGIEKAKAQAKEVKKAVKKYNVKDFIVDPSAYGRTITCPVMGNSFKISKDTPAAKYKGREYFFCCPSCIETFKNDPDKYAVPNPPVKK